METTAIIAGGFSLEREVSLRSAHRIEQALRWNGADTIALDGDLNLLKVLSSTKPTAIINLIHGSRGEDGSLSEVLELVGIPYVGQRPTSARSSFHKPTAKSIVLSHGIDTPPSITMTIGTFQELGPDRLLSLIVERIGLPIVIKPAKGGSGMGLSIARTRSELVSGLRVAAAFDNEILIEKYIQGVDIAVTVLDTGESQQVLPIVELHPKSEEYDYAARYTAGQTVFITPPSLPYEQITEINRIALEIHTLLQMRNLSRTDFILTRAGKPKFLEISGMPGLTESSPASTAIEAAGLDLASIYQQLTASAIRSYGR